MPSIGARNSGRLVTSNRQIRCEAVKGPEQRHLHVKPGIQSVIDQRLVLVRSLRNSVIRQVTRFSLVADRLPADGFVRSLSIAATRRRRSSRPIRSSVLSALRFIETESVIPDLSPVQNRVRRIAKDLDRTAQVLEVVEVILDRLPHEIGAAAAQLGRCPGGRHPRNEWPASRGIHGPLHAEWVASFRGIRT